MYKETSKIKQVNYVRCELNNHEKFNVIILTPYWVITL